MTIKQYEETAERTRRAYAEYRAAKQAFGDRTKAILAEWQKKYGKVDGSGRST